MFSSFMLGECGLNDWNINSEIVRAVASDPVGPYKMVERVAGPFVSGFCVKALICVVAVVTLVVAPIVLMSLLWLLLLWLCGVWRVLRRHTSQTSCRGGHRTASTFYLAP